MNINSRRVFPGWLRITASAIAAVLVVSCGIEGEARGADDIPLANLALQRADDLELVAEVAVLTKIVESIQHSRQILQAEHRELIRGIEDVAPIIPRHGDLRFINALAGLDDSPEQESALRRIAIRASEVSMSFERLSDEYSRLQSRALSVSVNDPTMRRIALAYSVALGLERLALSTWGNLLVYGEPAATGWVAPVPEKMNSVLSLLGTASKIYDFADRKLEGWQVRVRLNEGEPVVAHVSTAAR